MKITTTRTLYPALLLSINLVSFIVAAALFLPGRAEADDADAYKDFDSAFSGDANATAPEENSAPQSGEQEKPAANAVVPAEPVVAAPAVSAEPAPSPVTVAAEPPSAPSGDWTETIRMEGSLRNETAYRVRSHGQLSKVRNQALLVQSASLTDSLQLKATERGYYDAVYDLTDNYPENVRDDMDHELEFRDTYLDYSAGDFDIRLGKQQIVWGEALGLFFADVVNAKDLREFVLPDFDLIRIPEWGADVEYTRGDFHLELLYIPSPEMDEIGVENSEYEFKLPVPDGVPFRQLGAEEPANTFENGEWGMRLGYLSGGWDVGAFYLYTWDKFPVYFRSFDTATSELVLAPDFRRQHIGGFTFSKEVEPVVFKGEVVVNPESSFSTADVSDADGVVRKTYVDYILGADFKLFEEIDANVQFMERAIFDHDDTLINNRDAVRNLVSFWMKKSFWDGELEPEFLVLSSLMRVDLLIRPSVRYKFADHWDWKLGVDYFEGNSDELFGQFETGSRAYSEFSYHF